MLILVLRKILKYKEDIIRNAIVYISKQRLNKEQNIHCCIPVIWQLLRPFSSSYLNKKNHDLAKDAKWLSQTIKISAIKTIQALASINKSMVSINNIRI